MISKVLLLAVAVGAVCANNVQVPATGKVTFQSPGYPSNYGDNANVVYNIQGPDGQGIEFSSEHFDLENGNYDTLTFTEVVNGATVSLGVFSGLGGPSKLRSASNSVTATFKTDSSVTKTGFVVAAKVPVCPLGKNSCPGHETTCIFSRQYCDGVNDCPNNTDERNCPTPGSCGRQVIQPDIGGFRKLVAAMSDSDKIVGGTEAVPHSWPWQITFLTAGGSLMCGGSILNSHWVMTAAHCCLANSPVPASYRVRVGAHHLRDNGATEPHNRVHELERVVVHPNYNPYANDFCLLKLKEPVALSNHVSPVCLPGAEHGPTGKKCWVTGWGSDAAVGRDGGSFEDFARDIYAAEAGVLPKKIADHTRAMPLELRQVDVEVTDQGVCSAAYPGQITPDMICGAAPGKDSCQGDSGGPFVCHHDGEFKLVGVVSWGRGCAKPGYPGVYARTSAVLDWVNEHIYS